MVRWALIWHVCIGVVHFYRKIEIPTNPGQFYRRALYVHNVDLSRNDELKPSVAYYFRRFTNRCALAVVCGIEFLSFVQTVLTIGHSLSEKVQC